MSNSFVGAAGGTDTVTLPAHQAGDLLLVCARRSNNATPPSLPAGWTNIADVGGTTVSFRLGYKVAASSSETSGTWTNASRTIAHVYRGTADPGASWTWGVGTAFGNAGENYVSPALTLTDAGGTSWVADFAIYATDPGFTPSYAGLTHRTRDNAGVPRMDSYDTAAGVSAWTEVSDGASGSNDWKSVSIEIVEAAAGGPVPTPTMMTMGVGV